MFLLNLIFRNAFRHRLRTLLTVTGLMIAVLVLYLGYRLVQGLVWVAGHV